LNLTKYAALYLGMNGVPLETDKIKDWRRAGHKDNIEQSNDDASSDALARSFL
jgi:uncharacterized protein YdaT